MLHRMAPSRPGIAYLNKTDMRFRVTSIVDASVGKLIGSVTTKIEDCLMKELWSRDYGGGIEQFSAFFVSVDDDPLENEMFCMANNKAGRYKNLLTGKMVKFVGISIPVSPSIVLSAEPATLFRSFKGMLIEELAMPAYAMPKNFDRERLLADIKATLKTDE